MTGNCNFSVCEHRLGPRSRKSWHFYMYLEIIGPTQRLTKVNLTLQPRYHRSAPEPVLAWCLVCTFRSYYYRLVNEKSLKYWNYSDGIKFGHGFLLCHKS
jgi:hypothetical protein